MPQPTTTPKYPFYTLMMNTGYEAGTRVETVIAYISPKHKVQVDLIKGHERIEVDQPYIGEVFPPRWEPCEKYEWFEVLATKKQFNEGLKRFNAILKDAIAGKPQL